MVDHIFGGKDSPLCELCPQETRKDNFNRYNQSTIESVKVILYG